MTTKKQLGAALGRVPSGLFIVTACNKEREDGVLASWVNQCAFDPPSISVALATTRPARLLVESTQAFIVNILKKDANDLLKRFSKAPPAGKSVFDGLKTKKGFKDIAVLEDALAYLECEVSSQVAVGDHVLYVGKVVGGKMLGTGDPYTHVRQNGFNY